MEWQASTLPLVMPVYENDWSGIKSALYTSVVKEIEQWLIITKEYCAQ